MALVDRSCVGILCLSGKDSLDLLNRLSTNDLTNVSPDHAVPTILTSNKGRIIDLLIVLKEQDHLLLLTAYEAREKIIEWIEFYTITEDVVVRDITDETVMLSIVGPKATDFLKKIADLPDMCLYNSVPVDVAGLKTLLIRTDFGGLPAFDLMVNTHDRPLLWKRLLGRGATSGLVHAGSEAIEVVRVEQGVATYMKELCEKFNPLEANLGKFISFDKGCYIGQEIVARLDTYKKVQKRLTGLIWSANSTPKNPIEILNGKTQVGTLTSAVKSPKFGNIGLAYVKVAHANAGTTLTIEINGEKIPAIVTELPFTL